jgi:Cft2 family RNA processing exonuclease
MEVDGIKFTPYHAGHVLGAAMYFIEIAGVKVVFVVTTKNANHFLDSFYR